VDGGPRVEHFSEEVVLVRPIPELYGASGPCGNGQNRVAGKTMWHGRLARVSPGLQEPAARATWFCPLRKNG